MVVPDKKSPSVEEEEEVVEPAEGVEAVTGDVEPVRGDVDEEVEEDEAGADGGDDVEGGRVSSEGEPDEPHPGRNEVTHGFQIQDNKIKEDILPHARGGDTSIFIFPEQTKVVGSHNLGNTCYQNSTFQCLASIPALYNYMMGGHHSRAHGGHRSFCGACELEKVNFIKFFFCFCEW